MNTWARERPSVLITGATRGIGHALATEFAGHGCNLVLVARDGKQLDVVAGELKGRFEIDILTIAADLSQTDSAQRVFDQIEKEQIAVDILINNAGIASYGNFAETDLQRELRMMQINMISPVHLAKLFLRPMLARKHGRIVNVSSLAGYQPGGPKWAVYSATKSFVLSFSKALGVELRGTGVSVTAICPGATDTDFKTDNHLEQTLLYRAFAMSPARVARSAHRGIMARRSVVVPGFINNVFAIAGELPPRRIALEVNRWLVK